jgi:hypothetical protein
VADAIFEERRLAEIYDPLDPGRSDLDVYAALAEEFGARTVLDVGCTDGEWASMLRGIHAALRRGGRLAFEIRNPARQAWRTWDREHSLACIDIPEAGGPRPGGPDQRSDPGRPAGTGR